MGGAGDVGGGSLICSGLRLLLQYSRAFFPSIFFFASLHGALWRVEADVVSERGVGCCQLLKQGGYVMGRRVWSASQSFKALDFCYPAPPPHALCEPNVDGLKKTNKKMSTIKQVSIFSLYHFCL